MGRSVRTEMGFALALLGSLVASTTATIAEGTLESAEGKGWGWQRPVALSAMSELDTPMRIDAWVENDGSHAAYLLIPAGESLELKEILDTKFVILSGAVSMAGMTVGKGGFATSPAADNRKVNCITTESCAVYVEFEPGTGEMEAASLVAGDIPFVEVPGTYGNVSLAWVWGQRETDAPSSFFLKFKPGFPGFQHAHTHAYHGVVLDGIYSHWAAGNVPTVLAAGTTFRQDGLAAHDDACSADGNECVAYFRIADAFDVYPAE